jgi:hypothetical protein
MEFRLIHTAPCVTGSRVTRCGATNEMIGFYNDIWLRGIFNGAQFFIMNVSQVGRGNYNTNRVRDLCGGR